ncbi:hypothetical protein [Castellaniella sp.]|uniref:hypothetical protein n=1 Tax=Castellaniella sp. TaxID=1955812 RepID=UPI002AFDDAA5|nr:hypothetical protein [Castellaniella sp.]
MESRWYTLAEAAKLTNEVLRSTLPDKYWVKFFCNTSRGKRGRQTHVQDWMRVRTKLERGKVVIEENSLQSFLEEAAKRDFPLYPKHAPYSKRKTVTVEPDPLPHKESLAGTKINANRDENTPTAWVGIVDGKPSVIVEIGGIQFPIELSEAKMLAESLQFVTQATSAWHNEASLAPKMVGYR